MFQSLRKIFGLGKKGPHPKVVRNWRMLDCGDDGMYCFFDPKYEKIFIYPLTKFDNAVNIREYGSVSALVEGEGVAPHQIHLFRRAIDAES